MINRQLPLITIESKSLRLLLLVILCLITGGLFIGLGGASLEFLFGVSSQEAFAELSSEQHIAAVKFLQLLSSTGLFVVPAIIYTKLIASQTLEELKLKSGISASQLILLVLIFYSFMPILNWTVELNSKLQLPEYLNQVELWIRDAEDRAMDMTKAFLKMDSKVDLFYNLFLIALLPAVGEELIFRGVVQQTINKGLKNYHIGIWASAFLFSAIHMQFYGFLPRMLLGALFGYLFVWSSSLWVPMIAHFINNATAVFAVYYVGYEGMEKKLDTLGTTESTYAYSIIGLLLFISLLWYFKKISSVQKE